MTNGHAPYIMPDGRSLAAVLKAEGPTHGSLSSKRKNSTRPKDELWGQLQLNKVSATVTCSDIMNLLSRKEGLVQQQACQPRWFYAA